jgi:GH15 family glucan-1,4-alpha-glucosidase
VGNGAHNQVQLDVYGEVADAAARLLRRAGRPDRDTAHLLAGLGRTVRRRWREPDSGIWERRGSPAHYTHSKVLCWVALDRLIGLHEQGILELPVEELRTERAAIREAVERRGYSERLGSYTGTLDGEDLDAGLLLLPAYGYAPGSDPRVRATCARIRERLGRGALIYRRQSADGRVPPEGAFGVCGFWAVQCLAHGGDREEATRAFEWLLGYANDVGLFGEEIDPESGAALGNFPQAFTHVGLINAALTLAEQQ